MGDGGKQRTPYSIDEEKSTLRLATARRGIDRYQYNVNVFGWISHF